MHISIAGRLGSGKSTICNILKARYGYQIYSTGEIHREIANRQNVSTLEMNKILTKDSSHDYNIDDAVTEISIEKSSEVIIFDSRMAWKFAKNSFKVFVVVDPLVAAKRVIKSPRGVVEVYTSIEDAKLKLIERSQVENERFKQIYNVDNFDYSNYNLVIDSTYASPEKLASVIYNKYKKYCEGPDNYEACEILMAPTSLFPLNKMRNISSKIVDEYRASQEYRKRPISIIAFDGYHFIVNGHHRMLAAALNNEQFVDVKLASFQENLISTAQLVGISGVYDFEAAGNFRYASYPNIYIRQ